MKRNTHAFFRVYTPEVVAKFRRAEKKKKIERNRYVERQRKRARERARDIKRERRRQSCIESYKEREKERKKWEKEKRRKVRKTIEDRERERVRETARLETEIVHSLSRHGMPSLRCGGLVLRPVRERIPVTTKSRRKSKAMDTLVMYDGGKALVGVGRGRERGER